MIKKLKNWYTKPRSAYIFELSAWILNNPSALGVVFFMGLSLSTIIFLGLSTYFFIIGWLPAGIIMGVFGLAILYKLLKLWQLSRKTGILNMFDTMAIKDVIGGKNGITRKDIKKCNEKAAESNGHECPGNGKKPI